MAGENHPLKPTLILRRQKQTKKPRTKNHKILCIIAPFHTSPTPFFKIPMSSCLERRLKNLRQFLTESDIPFGVPFGVFFIKE